MTTVTAIVDGVTLNLTYDAQSQKWRKANINAPDATSGSHHDGIGPGVGEAARDKGYYPITVTAASGSGLYTSVDDQTPGAIGQACRLKAEEKTAPTIGTTYPAEGDYIKPSSNPMTWEVIDYGSGPSELAYATLDDTISITDITKSFSEDWSKLSCSAPFPANISPGGHNLRFWGYDYDGNVSQYKTVHFFANMA